MINKLKLKYNIILLILQLALLFVISLKFKNVIDGSYILYFITFYFILKNSYYIIKKLDRS